MIYFLFNDWFILGLSPGGKIKLIKSSSISLQSPFRFVFVMALVTVIFLVLGLIVCTNVRTLKITSLAKRESKYSSSLKVFGRQWNVCRRKR